MLRVIGWIDYDNFNFATAEGTEEEINAVAKSLKENCYKFGGDDHENMSFCCPLLSNGKALRMSWRGWGYVMAKAYDLKNVRGEYNYILWYMGEFGPEKKKMPKYQNIDLSECPTGKDLSYIVSKEEYHALQNASLTSLVLPAKEFEKLSIKTLDLISFIYEDKILIKGLVNDTRFMHCTITELADKDSDFVSTLSNSNFSDFNKVKMTSFIKNKFNILNDNNLIIIGFNICIDNRKACEIYI